MKRRIGCILMTLILAFQCLGCGAGGREETEGSGNEASGNETSGNEASDNEASRSEISDDPADLLGILSLAGKDNSLDVYSAVVNTPLEVEEPEGAISGGGSSVFLGASRAFYFQKHLMDMDRADESWDEVAAVTAGGEKDSKGFFDRKNQVWGAGPVAGTEHYVTFHSEEREGEEGSRYFLVERDESHEAVKELPLDFLDGSDFTEVIGNFMDFAVDRAGTVHFIRHMGGNWQYLLISPEGETLKEYVSRGEQFGGLVPLYDGRIGFWAVTASKEDGQRGQRILRYLDAEKDKPSALAAPEKGGHCFTLFDENTLLYANSEGIYRSGLSGDSPELLYRWINHGVTVGGVPAMQADETGRISLLYESGGKYNYLCLEPTTEEVEIIKITLAASPHSMQIYRPMVAAFNKKYPRCVVQMKSYQYGDTSLLTELTAGDGPILIDTSLTNFEEQEKLWEPLDGILEQLGVTEELVLSALELGRIDGTQYGIATNFRLCTLVTADPELKDWDYDTFLQCIEERPELESVFNFYGGPFGTYFIMSFLSHGIEDTFLWDEEAGTMRFDSSKFRGALELAKKYGDQENGAQAGSLLLEGKMLCNELSIARPEEIALCRIFYGEDINYIGYPTKDGSAHFIEGDSPLAIRRTATEEEKAVAAAFIGMCLSYEGQVQAAKERNFALSVRWDMLEEQIAAMNERSLPFVMGVGQFELGDDLNVELDRKTLLDLIDQAKPRRYFPPELQNILFEELSQYFAGEITEEMVINNLESRVGLYFGERK